jgi:hypothetical protein
MTCTGTAVQQYTRISRACAFLFTYTCPICWLVVSAATIFFCVKQAVYLVLESSLLNDQSVSLIARFSSIKISVRACRPDTVIVNFSRSRVRLKPDGTRRRRGGRGGDWRMEWVASTLTLPRNVGYSVVLTLKRTPRLPAVDWTDAPADLNGLVRFG